MLMSPQNYADNLALVHSRMAAAARRAGRDGASITLVAVSKGQPVEAIRAVHGLGVRDFGENYLQEAKPRMQALEPAGPTWHFIGQVQSNKTRAIAERFHWVHGVDRLQIARRLSDQRPFHAPPLNVCLQVRLEDEPGKAGAEPKEIAGLAQHVATLERLKLRGLMCMPPPTDDVGRQRGYFARLRGLLEELKRGGLQVDVLSMGMSADFETAIEEGATHVRVGTAIFGPRGR